jgi:hypothetical protein
MVSPRSLTSFLRHVFISFLNKGREPLLLVGRPDPSPQVLMSNDSFVHNEPTRLNHHGLVLSWLFLPPFFHELPNKSRKAKSRKNKNVQLFFFFLTIPSRLRCVRHHTCNRMNLWPVKFHCNEKEKRGAKLRHLYTLDNGICWTDLYTSSKLHKVNLATYSANVSSFFWGNLFRKWPLRLEIDRDSFFLLFAIMCELHSSHVE